MVNYLDKKFSLLLKIHFILRAHQTSSNKPKSLSIPPTMATFILAQHNNQPTIGRH
jgi:hypothetical protein